jgi:site-specific recombinase XerD
METTKESYLKELVRRKYSPNTIKVYEGCFKVFCDYFSNKNLPDLRENDIKDFLLFLVENLGISSSSENQYINSVKFYYEGVLNYPRKTYFLNRPRPEKKLPEILSTEEVAKLLNAFTNLKHYTIASILYGSGLRISELINLKIADIDSQRMIINVRQGKGKKDRQTLLSHPLLELLRKYYKQYHPKDYLFNGQQKAPKYSSRSIQQIIRNAACKARINKDVHPHTLRHCFATHLLESGVDIRYIQQLLGHAHLKTTEIYTHVTTSHLNKIVSPFDKLRKNIAA